MTCQIALCRGSIQPLIHSDKPPWLPLCPHLPSKHNQAEQPAAFSARKSNCSFSTWSLPLFLCFNPVIYNETRRCLSCRLKFMRTIWICSHACNSRHKQNREKELPQNRAPRFSEPRLGFHHYGSRNDVWAQMPTGTKQQQCRWELRQQQRQAWKQ